MSKPTSAQIRTLSVLEAFEHHGTLTTFALAGQLKLENPESYYHGRRLRNIIGDLAYTGYLSRLGVNSRASGKALPLFQLTAEGFDHLAYLKILLHAPAAAGATPAEVKDAPAQGKEFVVHFPEGIPVEGRGRHATTSGESSQAETLVTFKPMDEIEETIYVSDDDTTGLDIYNSGGPDEVFVPKLREEPVVAHILPGPGPLRVAAGPPTEAPKLGQIIQLPKGRPVSAVDPQASAIVPAAREIPVTPAYPTLGKSATGETTLDDIDKLKVVYTALKSRNELQMATLVEIVANNLKRQRLYEIGFQALLESMQATAQAVAAVGEKKAS